MFAAGPFVTFAKDGATMQHKQPIYFFLLGLYYYYEIDYYRY